MEYRMIADYHTHTIFSHGKGTIEDNVKSAIEKGLREIAISDHGPGHLTYGVKRSSVPVMRVEIDRLNQVYPEIQIYLSVEANVVDRDLGLDVTKDEYDLYDFVIAGYHYGITHGYCIPNFLYEHGIFRTDGRMRKLAARNTEMYLKSINNNKLKILTHPGDKGPVYMEEIAKACAKNNVLMEINSRHSHLTVEEIKIAMKEDVSFVISSDAHYPEHVGSFKAGLARAKEAGLDLSRIVNIEKVEV